MLLIGWLAACHLQSGPPVRLACSQYKTPQETGTQLYWPRQRPCLLNQHPAVLKAILREPRYCCCEDDHVVMMQC